jgi:hypothetical protein
MGNSTNEHAPANGRAVQLRLHSSIYLKAALQATKEAYEAFADIHFERQKTGKSDAYWIVDVSPRTTDVEPETLALEVSNFILAENMHAKRGEQA